MTSRYLPITVFAGCVIFSILHVVSTRLTERTVQNHSDGKGSAEETPTGAKGPHPEAKSPAVNSVAPRTKGSDAHDPTQVQQAAFRTDEIIAAWESKLVLLGNQPIVAQRQPALQGHLEICMGGSGKGIEASGEILIELFEHPHHGHAVEPARAQDPHLQPVPGIAAGSQSSKDGVKVQEWRLEPATLKVMEKPEANGDVTYAFYLPFTKYRADITKVSLKVTYQPVKGEPLTNDSNSFDLDVSGLQGWKPAPN